MLQPQRFSGKSGPRCILTIEDDIAVRASICHYLDDLDYLVVEADNGSTGLELFKMHNPDLILLDLRMPGISGLDFLQQIRETDSEVPVIVISATGNIKDVTEALRLGASDFLTKPIEDLRVLQHSVAKALEEARLREENNQYHEQLEQIIAHRTQTLERTYAKLKKSEEKHRSIYENLQDVYFEARLDGILQEISPSIEIQSKYQREDLIGTNIARFYANPEERQQLITALLKNGQVHDFEAQLIYHDDQPLYASINAKLRYDSSGQPTGLSGIIRDITERKTAEESLSATNQTLEVLFNAAPLAILAVDSEFRVTLWNQAAQETFGWSRDEVIGRPYPLAIRGKEDDAKHNLEQALSGNQFKGLELTRQRKDGQPVEISASTARLQDNHGDNCGVIIIIEDISEKRRLRSEADKYSRLASLGELAAGVAHEINNPNGLILLNLPTVRDFVLDAIELQQELAVEQPHLTLGGLQPKRAAEAFPQLMDEVEDSARRVKQIVDDLKSFAGQQSFEQNTLIDLNLSIETAVRLAANHLKKATFHFDSVLTAGLPQIEGSAQRIEQVIINLLVNACEALTDRQQKIQVTTGQDAKTQEVFFCISDEGGGINPQQLPYITDPFFTTRRETGGTGLGLSVSARIIKEHHARLVFTPHPEQGTTACVYFPLPQKVEQ